MRGVATWTFLNSLSRHVGLSCGILVPQEQSRSVGLLALRPVFSVSGPVEGDLALWAVVPGDLAAHTITQFCPHHFGMAWRAEKEQPVLTFRGPCSDGREVMKHLLCASPDACHLTYIVSHFVLTRTEEWATMMSVNSPKERRSQGPSTHHCQLESQCGVGGASALPIACHCLPTGKV